MKQIVKDKIKSVLAKTMLDWPMAVFWVTAAGVMRLQRRIGIDYFGATNKTFRKMGIFPVPDHFYEPKFNYENDLGLFDKKRNLPGIDFRLDAQLAFLKGIGFQKELLEIPEESQEDGLYYYQNPSFGHGSGEIWYGLIRKLKPKNIIEIGSGFSTAIAMKAIRANERENSNYTCDLTCIEPYPSAFLKGLGVNIIQDLVENIPIERFATLGANDFLFIDSSHVIRPGGDVLFEYQELLPSLRRGVYVHIHDIFTPRHYPKSWLRDLFRFWNEQYLLESFLSHNSDFEVVLSMHMLVKDHFDAIKSACPNLQPDEEPSSFYIHRV